MQTTTDAPDLTDKDIVETVEKTGEQLGQVRDAIGQVIFGQQEVIDLAIASILTGGHALLVGLPGLAKTKLVKTIGLVLGLSEKRVQFTPDLMPADIIGSEVLEESASGARAFRFVQGPVFSQLLMADEINRASPRTQSALLQAMQEKHVTVAGQRYDLPQPFHVLATQNPLEQEGTYPLPEAQLDRFVMEIKISYPDLDSERKVLFATTGTEEAEPEPVMTSDELMAAQNVVRTIPVGEKVVDAVLQLVRAARPVAESDEFVRENVAWGPSPRASQALMLGIRARAIMEGRLAPSIDDVIALSGPVLHHRMALTFAARADGITLDDVISRLTAELT
ncbi:MAG: MoxR family ATPase [Pseudomonadota bacterium]